MSSEDSTTPTFRAATLDDAPDILQTLEAAFGRWPDFDLEVTPLEHLRWKMQPPDGLQPNNTVGLVGSEVIAVELRWMSLAQLGDREVVTNDGMDQAVDPRYQGRGYSRQLNDAKAAQQQSGELGIDAPSRNERILGSRQRRENPRAERQLSTWVHDFSLRGRLGTRWRNGGAADVLRHLPSTLRPPGGPVASAASSYEVESVERFDGRADRLWAAARGQFDVARIRGASYLNWRYDRRAGPSSRLAAVLGRDLVGYAVVKYSRGTASLLDVLVDPAHPDAAAPLLRQASEDARALGCRRVTAWLPSVHPLGAALSAAGYVEVNQAVPIEFDTPPGSTAQTDLDRFRDEGLRMHITMGDFDFV